MLLIYVLLILLFVIAFTIASLLLIPFYVSLRFLKAGNAIRGTVAVSWLGLTLIHRYVPGYAKTKKKEKAKKTKFGWNNVQKLLSLSPNSIGTLLPIFSALNKSIRVQEFSGDITIGLDDPADTATIAGYLSSVVSAVNYTPNRNFVVHSSFQEECFDLSIFGKLRIRLLRITLSFIRALTKKQFRELLGAIRQ